MPGLACGRSALITFESITLVQAANGISLNLSSRLHFDAGQLFVLGREDTLGELV